MKDELKKNVRLVKLQIFPAAKKRQKASFHVTDIIQNLKQLLLKFSNNIFILNSENITF